MMNQPMPKPKTRVLTACLGLALLGALSACDRTPKPETAPATATAPMSPASAASQ